MTSIQALLHKQNSPTLGFHPHRHSSGERTPCRNAGHTSVPPPPMPKRGELLCGSRLRRRGGATCQQEIPEQRSLQKDVSVVMVWKGLFIMYLFSTCSSCHVSWEFGDLVALYWRFVCDSGTDSYRAMRTACKASKHTSPAKQRPFFVSPRLPVGG